MYLRTGLLLVSILLVYRPSPRSVCNIVLRNVVLLSTSIVHTSAFGGHKIGLQ